MGMLVGGNWSATEDRTMVDGMYRREVSALRSSAGADVAVQLRDSPHKFVLIASASCPWSHATVLASVLKGLKGRLALQLAGGPRVEGYGLLPGPLCKGESVRHVHQFYTMTDPNYTGRATVPLLWDRSANAIVSNVSADIIDLFNHAGSGPSLRPAEIEGEIATLTKFIFDGLSNAVYRAGKAQRQDEYDDAVDTVFRTMDALEQRLSDTPFLFGTQMTTADIRLFASLVRFDTVYATHFRCTRKRLVEYPALWRFTRRVYQMPGIEETVDFDEIRFGYYVNDGSHNPYGIVGQQPDIDWHSSDGLHN